MEHIEPPVQSAKRFSKIRSRMAMDAAFFGSICMRLKVVWVPTVSTEVDTMATDGKHLFINVGFFMTLGGIELSLSQLIEDIYPINHIN